MEFCFGMILAGVTPSIIIYIFQQPAAIGFGRRLPDCWTCLYSLIEELQESLR